MRAISEGFIMKAKQISLFLAGALLMSNAALAESSYTGTARGFGGDVTAEVGLDDAGKVVSLTVTADSETPTVGGAVDYSNVEMRTASAMSARIRAWS